MGKQEKRKNEDSIQHLEKKVLRLRSKIDKMIAKDGDHQQVVRVDVHAPVDKNYNEITTEEVQGKKKKKKGSEPPREGGQTANIFRL